MHFKHVVLRAPRGIDFSLFCFLCRVAHLIGAGILAAHPIVLVGLGGVEVEDKHQVPSLTHNHLVALVLHSNHDKVRKAKMDKKDMSS